MLSGIAWGIGKNRDILVTVLGCVICFMPILRYGCLSNAGAGFGFMNGWINERRFVCFRMDIERSIRMLRFVVGSIILLVLLTVGPSVLGQFMPERYASFFTNFIVAFFVMCIYPFFFSRLESDKPYAWKRRLVICVSAAMAIVLLGSMAGVYWKHRTAGRQQQDTGQRTRNCERN